MNGWDKSLLATVLSIGVEKLEGTGRTFTKTSKAFHISVEDVPVGKLKLSPITARTSNRTTADARVVERYELSSKY